MYRLIFILLLIAYNGNIFSQKIKISKVIDSNLFELKDSSRIKLAGIDAPRLDNPDYFLSRIAKDAVLYTREKLIRKTFSMKVINENDGVKTVYLIEEYPFGDKIHNLEFLRKGFGKFIDNIDTNDAKTFYYAELNAKKEDRGIWNIIDTSQVLILDREYSESERNDPALTDSIEYLIKTTPEPGIGHIASEIVLAPAVGIIAGIPVGALSVALFAANDHGEWAGFGEALLGWYTGYLIGNGLCVYAISNMTTKKVSPFGSILFSALGGGFGIGLLASLNNKNDNNNWLWFAPLVLPVVSSVIYANCIAPDKFSAQDNSSQHYLDKKHLTAADMYNHSKLFEINLLKIRF